MWCLKVDHAMCSRVNLTFDLSTEDPFTDHLSEIQQHWVKGNYCAAKYK